MLCYTSLNGSELQWESDRLPSEIFDAKSVKIFNHILPILQNKDVCMSQSEPADLLSRLYNELAQRIVEQCTQEFLATGFISQLNLAEHLSTSIEAAVQQATGVGQTEELEQQVLLVGQMIDVLEGALQDHRS